MKNEGRNARRREVRTPAFETHGPRSFSYLYFVIKIANSDSLILQLLALTITRAPTMKSDPTEPILEANHRWI